MAGRHSKLDSETVDVFLDTLKGTGNVRTSTERACIGVTTVYRWLELGNKAKSGPFWEFWNAFWRAKGDFNETYGRLDCAFNNAGIEGQIALTPDCSIENWNRVIAINLTGVFLFMKYEIALMLRHGGAVSSTPHRVRGWSGLSGPRPMSPPSMEFPA